LCATHAGKIVSSPASTTARVVVQTASNRTGFFKKFTMSLDCFLPVKTFLNETVIPKLADDIAKRGRRKLFNFAEDQKMVLEPLLLSIVSLAKTELHFPLNSYKIQTPNLVVAPASSGFSNAWTKGILHRDFLDTETSGVYTFMLFIDEVTEANGTVEFWPHSQRIALDDKNPERAIVKSGPSETLVGPSGTVMVWDSRILHRSLPNATQNRRLSLLWNVTSKQGLTLINTSDHPMIT
jgi:hypothetical protein